MDILATLLGMGGFLWTLAFFILAIAIIVFVHEYGHYIVGRWSGIHAEVFSLGFGPVIWSGADKRGTRWQIAALPFGGYVKFLGDANAASSAADDEVMSHLDAKARRRTMHGAPLWARAATIFAGPAFNFLFSIAVFAAFMVVKGLPLRMSNQTPLKEYTISVPKSLTSSASVQELKGPGMVGKVKLTP